MDIMSNKDSESSLGDSTSEATHGENKNSISRESSLKLSKGEEVRVTKKSRKDKYGKKSKRNKVEKTDSFSSDKSVPESPRPSIKAIQTCPSSLNTMTESGGVTHKPDETIVPSEEQKTTVDNSDEASVEVFCPDHGHFDLVSVDRVVDLTVDEIFEAMFTNAPAYQRYVQRRKIYDVKAGDWPDQPDEKGMKVRQISYVLSLNYAVGPKSMSVTENQSMRPESVPGELIVIDSEGINAGIPYANYFYCYSRICMRRLTRTSSHLRISTEIRYTKSVWGLIKKLWLNCSRCFGLHLAFIQKTAKHGVLTSYGVWGETAYEEGVRRSKNAVVRPHNPQESPRESNIHTCKASKHTAPSDTVSTGDTRSRKCPQNPEISHDSIQHTMNDKSFQAYNAPPLDTGWRLILDVGQIVKIMLFLFSILVLVNVFLYWKLTSLEKQASIISNHQRIILENSLKQAECTNIPAAGATQPQTVQEKDIEKWIEVLSSSSYLMVKLKETMAQLKDSQT